MTKTQYIKINKSQKWISFSQKVELNRKPVTVTRDNLLEYLKMRYKEINPFRVTTEYTHINERTGAETRFRLFADGVVVDGKKYICLKY